MKKLLVFLMCSINLLSDWNGEAYAKNLSLGKKEGFGVVSRIELEHAGAILDVGCGDGSITKLIAEKFRESQVLGLDFSTSMIAYANKAYAGGNLHFKVEDARALDAHEEFDLILSLGVMQWIKEQDEVLTVIHKALKPQGELVIQMPLRLPDAFQEALEEALADANWSSYFVGYNPPWNFYHLGEYLFFLYDAGFVVSDMQVFIADEVYSSKEVFAENLRTWLPFIEVLPVNKQQDFLSQVIARYLALVPAHEDGYVHYEEPLLEIKAHKNL